MLSQHRLPAGKTHPLPFHSESIRSMSDSRYSARFNLDSSLHYHLHYSDDHLISSQPRHCQSLAGMGVLRRFATRRLHHHRNPAHFSRRAKSGPQSINHSGTFSSRKTRHGAPRPSRLQFNLNPSLLSSSSGYTHTGNTKRPGGQSRGLAAPPSKDLPLSHLIALS
jgi:hypothetical protein